jgi:ankyrin repeat protein
MLLLLVTFSLRAGSGEFRLAEAAQSQDSDAVRSLLKQHPDVNAAEPDGATALAWAAHWDNLDIASLLIAAWADVNAANNNGITPLWLACSNGSAAMVEKLLEAGADPVGNHLPAGETPLLRCAASGNVAAVKSLLARGVDVNIAEKSGQTPLMWALEERHPEVARERCRRQCCI